MSCTCDSEDFTEAALCPVHGTSPDNLQAFFRMLIAAHDHNVVVEHEQRLHDQLPPIPEGHVALFGFEGQLDRTWLVLSPRPARLRVPIPPARRHLFASDDEEFTPMLRTATYRRVAESTYVRIE